MEWIAAVVGVLISNVVTYLLARRKTSGRIDVSEAAQIWTEAGRQRTVLQKRIRDLEANELARRIEIHELRNEMTKLHFMVAGNVPQEIQDELTRSSREHVEWLRRQWEAKHNEPINHINGLERKERG